MFTNNTYNFKRYLFELAAPQIAATTSGDCTFEVDECGWSNVASRERLDDIDWERTSGAALRSTAHDHTLGTEKGNQGVNSIIKSIIKNIFYLP